MKKIDVKTCLTVGVSAFLLYLAIHYWTPVSSFLSSLLAAALPLFIGFCIAYIISLPMGFFERKLFPRAKKKWLNRARRPLCLVLSVLCLLAIFSLVTVLVLPQLISCVQLIANRLPGFIDKGIDLMQKHHLLSDSIVQTLDSIDWKSRIGEILNVVTTGVSGVMTVLIETVTGVISGVVTAFLSFIFACYLLLSQEKLKGQLSRFALAFFPQSFNRTLFHVIDVVGQSFRKYIVGQCVEALLLGILCAMGMLILRLPYAAMISALIAFTALIPIAGAYIGAAVGAFMILTVSPMKALIFLIFLVILQQLEGNLIYPRVVGSSLGLPGLWVLAAVTVGGALAGVVGMLLGVPLAAALYKLLREAIAQREEKAQKVK